MVETDVCAPTDFDDQMTDGHAAKQCSFNPVWNERFICRADGAEHVRFTVCIDHFLRNRTTCGECAFSAQDLWSRAMEGRQIITVPLQKKLSEDSFHLGLVGALRIIVGIWNAKDVPGLRKRVVKMPKEPKSKEFVPRDMGHRHHKQKAPVSFVQPTPALPAPTPAAAIFGSPAQASYSQGSYMNMAAAYPQPQPQYAVKPAVPMEDIRAAEEQLRKVDEERQRRAAEMQQRRAAEEQLAQRRAIEQQAQAQSPKQQIVARQEDPGTGAIQPYGIPPMNADAAVEETKRNILAGKLRVGVYNQKLQVEWKTLAVNLERKQLTISDDNGQGNASFKISDLVSIQQGIHSSIVDPPPPADRVVAFQFGDGTLCVLFDNAETCQMALKALKQLCEVPVYT